MHDFLVHRLSELESLLQKNQFEVCLEYGYEFIVRLRTNVELEWIYVASAPTILEVLEKLLLFLQSKNPQNPFVLQIKKFSE